MPELAKSESNEDLGFDSNAQPPRPKPARPTQPSLTQLKVNLSTPLNVKTKAGELQAGPGDVVGRFGNHDVMMSKDLFIALLGRKKYDDLVRKEMLKVAVARRLDDSLPPFTDEELSKEKERIEEVMKASQQAEKNAFDPRDIAQVLQITDSSEGPPTTKPDEYATIVPGPMIPLPEQSYDEPVELDELMDPEKVDNPPQTPNQNLPTDQTNQGQPPTEPVHNYSDSPNTTSTPPVQSPFGK